MKSLLSAVVHSDAALGTRPRPSVRLVGLAPAALLLCGLFTVWAGPLAPPAAAASGDWAQFHNDPTHAGYNSTESTISPSNVASLGVAWTGATGSAIGDSPAVANGVVYVGSNDGKLYAYAVGCNSGGGSCSPIWTGATGSIDYSSPAVANGVVYVGSDDKKLYAYAVGCASGGGSCTPLWTGTTGGGVDSSPVVANGVVYVGSDDHDLYAFAVGCASGGGSCSPLWRGITGDYIQSSPAVANGVVYVGSHDGKLYAYSVNCFHPFGFCAPLWTGATSNYVDSSPVVANGVVYVGSADIRKLYAFDAAGVTRCSGSPETCSPLWQSAIDGTTFSSPAVANGVVYVGSDDGKLYAYAVGCGSGGGSCSPLWTGATGGRILSSPAVANGVVYVGSDDDNLYAYAVGCSSGGGSCSPLWIGHTGNEIWFASPSVSNGVVYVGSEDGKLYAFGLPAPAPGPVPITGSTYHAINPARLLDTRSGNGLSGPFSANAPRTFQVTGRGGVPSGATAVTGNLTVTDSTAGWAVFLGPNPTGSPSSSTINFGAGEVIANGVTVALSSTGTLSATYMSSSGNTTDLVFDVTGYFTPDTSGSTYHAISPARLLDTRSGNGLSGPFSANTPRTFAVTGRGGVPSGATAVTGNLTVTDSTAGWAAYLGPNPTGSPGSSTINFGAGEVIANGVTVALGGGGTLSATYMSSSGNTTDLVFDVTGYFTPDTSGSTYHAMSPARLLDTRSGNGLSGAFSANSPRTFGVTGRAGIPAGATGVTGNLTVTDSTAGWAAFLGPDPIASPGSSTINFGVGEVIANGVTVALGSGGTLSATYMSSGGATTDLVFDVTGYFVPASWDM